MHLNQPNKPRLRIIILLNYQLKNEVSWANFTKITKEFLIDSNLCLGSIFLRIFSDYSICIWCLDGVKVILEPACRHKIPISRKYIISCRNVISIKHTANAVLLLFGECYYLEKGEFYTLQLKTLFCIVLYLQIFNTQNYQFFLKSQPIGFIFIQP